MSATDAHGRLAFDEGKARELRQTIESRIVVTPSGCWEYQGHRSRRGYCDMRISQRSYRVHRVAYAVFVGPFDNSLLICHRCDNPPCANPGHLFTGNHKANALDASSKGRMSVPGPRGETHAFVTVCDEAAREAVRRCAAGESQRSVALSLGVCQGTVSNWVLAKTRRDLTGGAA